MTQHFALLGDSIFDNFAYTEGRPAVIDQVKQHLPPGWRASLLAVDGSVTRDIARQVRRVPDDVTHLALSVGGNDALETLPRLSEPSASVMASLTVLSGIQDRFERDYRAALDAVLALDRPLTVCTIYDRVPGLTPPLKAALSLFNDVILREAIQRGLSFLDLRTVCTEAEDYSPVSPIEPSSIGGNKLARALVRVAVDRVAGHGP